MKLKVSSIIVVLLAFKSLIINAQEFEGNFDHLYGYDALLFNGRIYSFLPETGTIGSQYLLNEFDINGKVNLRGVSYFNLTINYDLYNQQLILKYTNAIGSVSQIEISEAWLESFELYSQHFEYLILPDSTKRIFQVLGDGPLKVAYYRRKDISLNTRTSSTEHYFSDPILEKFLLNGNQMNKFKNNRTFLALFSTSKQTLIKKYLRQHNIKIKKANDKVMTELINFCNTSSGS